MNPEGYAPARGKGQEVGRSSGRDAGLLAQGFHDERVQARDARPLDVSRSAHLQTRRHGACRPNAGISDIRRLTLRMSSAAPTSSITASATSATTSAR